MRASQHTGPELPGWPADPTASPPVMGTPQVLPFQFQQKGKENEEDQENWGQPWLPTEQPSNVKKS